MRVSISAIGSVVVIQYPPATTFPHSANFTRTVPTVSYKPSASISKHPEALEALPGGFDYAGDFAGQREFPETDPAQFELA